MTLDTTPVSRGRREAMVDNGFRASPYLLSGLLTVTGVLHFVAPNVFARIVPPQLPWPTGLVYASGAAELACAAGLAVPRTRATAACGTAVLLAAVFPANVQMALDAHHRPAAYRAAAYLRVPLQVPLVAWAVSVARATERRNG